MRKVSEISIREPLSIEVLVERWSQLPAMDPESLRRDIDEVCVGPLVAPEVAADMRSQERIRLSSRSGTGRRRS